MTIISSQHFIDTTRVAEKVEALRGATSVTIPCIYVGEIDGVEYAAQLDGHNTLAAARELNIPVRFDLVEVSDYADLTGEEILDRMWMGEGDWYNVETSNPAHDDFDYVW